MPEKVNYNPDILTCLANLSSDEVFTPPEIANAMLDMLPQELFKNPHTKFLDPGCKSGVFLREIAKRLNEGLKEKIPDLEQRMDHIMKKQLFAIAITQITSLLSRRSVYCTKDASSRFSVARFEKPDGNIRFRQIPHKWNGIGKWEKQRCVLCGAPRKAYDRGVELETYAYEFIHLNENDKKELFDMKFDVIIMNPPYQLDDGGAQASATPIYNHFIDQAKKLNPKYISAIIPARWYGGGKGLDSFRQSMIEDKHIRELHDFLNASDCFGTGVEIKGGVCYFLRDRENPGKCRIVTHKGSESTVQEPRYLKEEKSDVLIRYAEGVSVLHKVQAHKEQPFSVLVSSQKPFDLRTYIKGRESPFSGSLKLYQRGGIGYVTPDDISKNKTWVDAYKVFISAAYNAGDAYPHQILGRPILGEKGSCCTETYVVIGPFGSEDEARNVMAYISTRFFRFLVMLKKTSQHAPASVYSFVPIQDFSKPWTDEELYQKYSLSDDEIAFIKSMIKPMDLESSDV